VNSESPPGSQYSAGRFNCCVVGCVLLSVERLADPERKRRFVQEAKAASALNHPNIVHIYDIADADGIQFIAMDA
jgi:eukaryotic-like serine/threonine-protein kinase